MIKQTFKTLIQIPRASRNFQFYQFKQLNYNNFYKFSSNDDKDPVKGFSKFKRKRSPIKTVKKQEIDNDSQIESQQNQKNNENKVEELDNMFKKRDDVNHNIEKENVDKFYKNFVKNEEKNKSSEDFYEKPKKQSNIDESLEKLEQQFKNSDKQIDDEFGAQGFSKFKRRKSGQKKNPVPTKKIEDQQENQIENKKQEEEIIEKKEDLQENKEELTESQLKEEEYRKNSEKIKQRQEKLGINQDDQQQEENNKQKPMGFTTKKGFKKRTKKNKEPSFFKEENEKEDKSENKQKKNNIPPQPTNMASQLGWRGMFLIGLGATLIFSKFKEEQTLSEQQISYTEFFKFYLEKDDVLRISINRTNDEGNKFQTFAKIYTKTGEQRRLTVNNIDNFLEQLEKTQIAQGKTPNNYISIDFQYTLASGKVFERIVNLIFLGATIGIVFMMIKNIKQQMQQFKNMTGGGGNPMDQMGMGNKIKIFGLDSKIETKFKDVAGQDAQKQEIMEFVDFLKNPEKYSKLGARLPKGAILTGPPGTGKTLLAKACAGEAGVPFLFMAGSDFVEMFVGVGSSRVRELFKKAKEKSPSIIFIDEIDAVGKKRSTTGRGNDERDNTLNQLLVELDGFGTDTNVIVLAATNRKDMLDEALTRPGRFDRSIEVDLPDIEGRKQIFCVHLKGLTLDLEVHSLEEYAKRLATLTPGFSGADIANLCNEAALLAARKNKLKIQTIDFEMASERVMAGLEKKTFMSEIERKTVAVHEAGHAVVGWFLEGGNPLIKVTIIPRSKGSLGYAQYLPDENSLQTKEDLLDQVCAILGGRVAEEIFFGKITTGASNDLEKAYKMVSNMVTKLGMSEKIGYVGFRDPQYKKDYSKGTNTIIDEEINRIIKEQTERCRQVILEHKDKIQNLSDELLEKNTLDLRQIKPILGERPFKTKSNYRDYLESSDEIFQELEQQKEQEQNQKKQDEIEENKKKENEEEIQQNDNNGQQNNKDENQQQIKEQQQDDKYQNDIQKQNNNEENKNNINIENDSKQQNKDNQQQQAEDKQKENKDK